MKDKIYHFTVCFAITIIASVFLPLWASVMTACIVGVCKEVYDLHSPDAHTAEWGDLLADLIGIVFALVLILIFT